MREDLLMTPVATPAFSAPGTELVIDTQDPT